MITTNKITLTGKQLIDALSLITGGGALRNLTIEELETEIDIQHMDEWRDDEVGLNPAGLYANLSEYPEEGVYGPLGDTHEANEITARANADLSDRAGGGARS